MTEQLTLFGAVSESPPVAGSADDLAAQAVGYASAEDCAVQNACIGPYSVGPLCWTPCAWMKRRMDEEQNAPAEARRSRSLQPDVGGKVDR